MLDKERLTESSMSNSNKRTSPTVSILKSRKILTFNPRAVASFSNCSGFGFRIPNSYFLIVPTLIPDRADNCI